MKNLNFNQMEMLNGGQLNVSSLTHLMWAPPWSFEYVILPYSSISGSSESTSYSGTGEY